MLRNKLFWLAQIIVLAGLLTGCGKKASDEIDFGTFTNSVYHNNYFPLTVTIPQGWSIQDQEAKQRLLQLGQNALAGTDKNMQAGLKASELQSVNMFTVFEHPVGAPVAFNPSIISIAEQVRQQPGIQTGKDYFFHVKTTLQAGQIKVSFPKDIYSQQLGGVSFDVMSVDMAVRGITVHEKYYTAILKGYALSFIVVFSNNEEETMLQKVLDTATFK